MAPADRLTGSGLVVRWTPSGGSLTIVSGDQTAFSFDRQLDTADVTAGNEQERYFAPTIEALDFELMIFDANQSYMSTIKPRTQGLLEIMKTGVGVGKPIISFNALLTGFSEEMPFDGALEITLSGVRQGAMIADFGTVQ